MDIFNFKEIVGNCNTKIDLTEEQELSPYLSHDYTYEKIIKESPEAAWVRRLIETDGF